MASRGRAVPVGAAAQHYIFYGLSVRHTARFCFGVTGSGSRPRFFVPADRIDAAAAQKKRQRTGARNF